MANTIEVVIKGEDRLTRIMEKIARNARAAFGEAIDVVNDLEREIKTIPDIDIDVDTKQAMTQLASFEKMKDKIDKDIDIDIDVDTKGAIRNLDQVREKMREVGARAREMGEGMIDYSENVAQVVTVPLALIGGVAFKASADQNRMFNILQARTKGVGKDLKELEAISKNVFRKGLGEDVGEIANLVGHARKQFQELNQTDLNTIIEKSFALARLYGEDATGAIDDAREIMDEFGVTANEAMDLVASGYNAGALEGQDLNKVLRESKGAADALMKAIQGDNYTQLIAQWRELQEALKPIGDELVKLSLKYLPVVIEKIKQFGEWFSKLSPEMQLTFIGLAALTAIMPMVIMFLGALVMTGGALIDIFALLGTTGGGVGLAIAGVIAGMVILYKNFQSVRDVVDKTWNQIKTMFDKFKPVLEDSKKQFMSYIEPIKKSFGKWVEGFLPKLKLIGTGIVAALVIILPVLNGIFRALAPLLKLVVDIFSFLENLVSSLIALLTGDTEQAKQLFQNALDSIVEAVKSFRDIFIELFDGIWDGAKAILSAFGIDVKINMGIIKKVFSMSGAEIWKVVTQAFGILVSKAKAKLQELKAGAAAKWNEIKANAVAKWNEIKNAALSPITNLASNLLGKWNQIKSNALSKFNEVKNNIINPIKNAATTIKGWIDRIQNWFRSMKISIPKPKLPRVSISTAYKNIAGTNIPYPKFSVNWYKKGGVFDGASIIGVGEAGPEAVVPLSGPRMQPFADEIARLINRNDQQQPAQQPTIIIEKMIVQNESDIKRIAEELYKLTNRERRTTFRGGMIRI